MPKSRTRAAKKKQAAPKQTRRQTLIETIRGNRNSLKEIGKLLGTLKEFGEILLIVETELDKTSEEYITIKSTAEEIATSVEELQSSAVEMKRANQELTDDFNDSTKLLDSNKYTLLLTAGIGISMATAEWIERWTNEVQVKMAHCVLLTQQYDEKNPKTEEGA